MSGKSKRFSSIYRGIALVICIAFVLAIATACSTKPAGNFLPGTGTEVKDTTPTAISIWSIYAGEVVPPEDSIIIKEIEKRTNTKLTITWIGNAQVEDKNNLVLASGDVPDVMFHGDPNKANIRTAFEQGMFWDITDLYKNYKNLAAIPELSYINTKAPDGRVYGIPKPRPLEGYGTFEIRQDWLDALKLKSPTNMDELYNVLKAFAKNDPDKNGKDDTIGLVGTFLGTAELPYGIRQVENAYNKMYGQWKDVGGKLVFNALLPEDRDALLFIKKLYDEKLINEDFAILKDAAPLINGGKVGLAVIGAPINAWTATTNIAKVVPTGKMVSMGTFNGVAFKGTGHAGIYAISKKVPEAKMKKILDFFDQCYTVPNETLLAYGIENVHYTKTANGEMVAIPDAVKKDVVSGQTFGQLAMYMPTFKYSRAGEGNPSYPKVEVEYNKKIIDEVEKVSICDPITGLYSPTGDKLLEEYYKKNTDLKLKIILGQEPIASWDKYVTSLKADATFVKIQDELSKAYAKKMGK